MIAMMRASIRTKHGPANAMRAGLSGAAQRRGVSASANSLIVGRSRSAMTIDDRSPVIAKAEALLKDITPEPWKSIRSLYPQRQIVSAAGQQVADYLSERDAAFFVAAPQLVRDLLAQYARDQQEKEQLKKAVPAASSRLDPPYCAGCGRGADDVNVNGHADDCGVVPSTAAVLPVVGREDNARPPEAAPRAGDPDPRAVTIARLREALKAIADKWRGRAEICSVRMKSNVLIQCAEELDTALTAIQEPES